MPDDDRTVQERRAEVVEILAAGVLRALEKQAAAQATGAVPGPDPTAAPAVPAVNHRTRMQITEERIVSRNPLVIQAKFVLDRKGRRRPPDAREPTSAPGTTAKTSPEVPQVAQRLAEAHAFQRLLDDGKVKTQAELARNTGLTRARITQIMNLLLLAPDLQEEVLMMKPGPRGRDPISERQLRHVAAAPEWDAQRRRWAAILRGEARRADPSKAPRVRILFSKEAELAGERTWDASQRVKPVARGVIFTMDALWTPAFVRWVLGFGDRAEVLAPASLRTTIAAELSCAAARYVTGRSRRAEPAS